MKNVYIVALHLAFGGIEKAICNMANIFAENYNVEILSVYNMPNSPAFPLSDKVKVRYLLKDIPNKEEWRRAFNERKIGALIKESCKSIKILAEKRLAVINAIKKINDGVIICTRHEDNLLLSKYGNKNVLKIAQIHHDHNFEKKYIEGFRNSYGGIDALAMLTPGLRDEVENVLREKNKHTRVIYMPNFLEHFPKNAGYENREKTIVAVGRLNSVKRFDLLIKCFAAIHDRAPEWKLRIIGEGEERGKIEAVIKEHRAGDYVILTGMQDSGGVEREMLNASIYAMTSASEGFPFVLLEAQSCGLPIIAYDVRVGPGFVVKDGIDGILVPEGDIGRFENELLNLMLDYEKRLRFSEKSLVSVQSFSADSVSQMWHSVIGD